MTEPSPPDPPPPDWYQIGYARAMAVAQGIVASTAYPTRDQYSEADEMAFISGFNMGERDRRSGDLDNDFPHEAC
jgi:hypothetical protein